MEDNLRSIYDKLVSSGSTGTYDEFVSFFNENDQNKKSVYDKLLTLGSKGTYDEFLTYAGAGQQPASERVDVSDVQQAEQGNTTVAEATEIPTVTMEQLEQQPTGAPAPGSDGHFLGNISVGADGKPKPMEDNPLRNPDNQPGEERTIPEIEVQRQKVDEVSQALSEATRQRNEQRAQQQREREEEIGFWGRLAKGLQAAENPITPEVVEVITNPTDNDLRAAQNEVRSAKKQLQLEEMRQNGEMKGLAFIRGIETANYYDLIPVLGTADAMSILSLSQALKEGKELTESQQLLLQAMEARAGVDFNYKDNNTIWERVGQSTPEQLMFTLQFVIGGGLTGATEAGERIAAKEAQKAAIRYAKKGVNSGARRFIGGTVLPNLEGMAVSSTIQTFANPLSLASMAEDFERRYAGDVYYDNDGNLHVFDNDRSAGQAAYQAVASAWIENFTEYSGQNITKSIKLADGKMFDLAGKFNNVMKNVGGGRIKDVFTVPQKLSHLTQIGSAPEEFLEEELGSVMNALFATDAQRGESYGDAFKRTVSQSFSGEQQLETLLSVTITSTLLGGGGNAVNAVGNAGYRREANREVERSKALLGKVHGIDIAELDNQIENGQISDIASYLKAQSDANGWSQDEQGAAVNYVLNRARQIGMKHHDDIAIEEAQQEMRQQAEDMANRWDGNIYNATWKDNEGNEQPVTIINGRIHYNTRENGTIHFDPYTSSGMIAIRLSDGTKKQVPSRTITGIQSVMSVDEQLEAQGNTIPQMMQAQFEQEGMAIPTVESVWGGNLVANETQFEDGKYTFLGQDQNGLYAFANNDKRTQKDNPIIYMTERQLVEYGLSLNIQAANATGNAETAQQAQDDLDFMHHLDELTAEATEKDQWDVVKAYASRGFTYEENGMVSVDTDPRIYAAYLLACAEGSFENAMAGIDESVAALVGQQSQQEQAADISTEAGFNAENMANAEQQDGTAAKAIDFYNSVYSVLFNMQAGQQDAVEESVNEMPVSQMEVGQEFPVMYDGQQAVAAVVGKDADGRNVLTIRDQEGNDLESGIDDWTDEQWERFRVRPEEATVEPQQERTEPEAEGIEQQSTETEQDVPENEQQEEVPVSPAQQTFDGLVQKYGDKAGHKIDVTAEDKSKTLDKAKKALEKAQTDYDDAPIGKEEKAEAALQKAQEEYNTALAEKQEWDEVKSVKDRFVAEQIAAKQAAEEERYAQAVAEEEARRAEEERKAREREATGVNNVAPNIREKWEGAPRVEGNADEITLANGERIAGHYVLVESGAASASHDALNGFAKTEGFPLDENEQSVNDRDYERDKNAQQITRQIANEYDSRALQDPVVVSQDGVVLSGNGRTMAGEIAAAQDTDGAYIDYLKKYAPKFGFTPEQVEGMAHPRVVFVPDASMPYTAETFAKFNQQEMKGQSKTEQAVKLGKLVDDATFGRIIRSINRFDTLGDFYADTNATADAIGELLKAGAINQMQHTEMFDGDAISAQGREILENMLIGKAFESNPDAVRQLAAYKSLRQSVITALAEISNNIALGEYSLESELSDAIALAYNARKNGYKAGDAVSEFARQGKLFETEEDATAADYTNATVLMLADLLNDNRVTRLKKAMAVYNNEAAQSAAGQTDLFAEGVKTKQDILNEVLLLLQHGTESEQQQALDAAREQRKAAAEQGTGVQEDGDTGEGGEGERGVTPTEEAEKDAFKDWFGDWENDPQNASKVVDADGKPMVVYHSYDRENYDSGLVFMSKDKNFSKEFGENTDAVYVNLRNPYIAKDGILRDADGNEIMFEGEPASIGYLDSVPSEYLDWLQSNYDGVMDEEGTFIVAFSPDQIKKAPAEEPPMESAGEGTEQPAEQPETEQKKASFSFNPNTALGKTAIVYIQKWLDELGNANKGKRGYKKLLDTLKKIAKTNGRQDFFAVFNEKGEMLGVGANAAEAYEIALNHDEESFNVVRQTSTDNGTVIGFTNGWLFTNDIPESEWRDDSGRLRQEVKDASITRLAKELEIEGENTDNQTEETPAEQPKESREELDKRLMEERKQRILAEGTSFDKPFGLVPVSETMTVEDIDTNMQRIAEGLKANEGNKDFGNFYGFAYQGNFKENAGQQVHQYFYSLGGVVPNETLNAWAEKHGIKSKEDVVEYGKKLYDETNRTDKTDKETEEEPKKETKKQANTPSKAGPAKIDDVGEKIGGARKDLAQQMSGKIKLDADTFPKMFPKFDLKKLVEQGLDPKMAAAVMFLRQAAYAEYKQKNKRQGKDRALAAAKFFAAYAKQVLEKGDTDVEFTDSGWVFTDYGKIHMKANIALYGKIHDKMGNDMFDVDLTGYEIFPVNVDSKSTYTAYRKNEKGENVPFKPRYVTRTKSRTSYFKEDELDQAIDEVVSMVEQGVSYDKSHPYKLGVYYTRGKDNSFYVGVKIGNEVKALTEPGGLDATRAYLNEHEAELQAEAARVEQQTKEAKKKERPVAKVEIIKSDRSQGALYGYVFAVKIGKEYVNIMDDTFDLRTIYKYEKEHHDELQEKAQQMLDQYLEEKESGKGWKPQLNLGGGRARVGEDYRKGRDIGADEFRDTFGFRGVEFGNYVTQKERQRYLNEAYDAFMDLADLLGVSPRALSLGGQLGFAIGARGGGGKNAAHYEPELNVINLTKTQGAGSVAHEWWHALDFYFNQRNGERKRPATGNTVAESFDASVRMEMAEAFVGLMEKVNDSEYFRRSKRLDNKTNRQYFATDTELGARAFQDYVQRRLTERGQVNDFLSSFTPEEQWNGEETTYPYPTGEEANAIDERFDNLFSTMEERKDEKGNTILFSVTSQTEALAQQYQQKLDEIDRRMAEADNSFVRNALRATRQGYILKYLDRIKDAGREVVVYNNDNLVTMLKGLNVHEADIREVERLRASGRTIEGFCLGNAVYINADAMTDIDLTRSKFVHERQHAITRQKENSVYLQAVLHNATRKELQDAVDKMSGARGAYNSKPNDILADEFISFAMERAYSAQTDAELEETLAAFGINRDLIEIIKLINHEQRNNESLSTARKPASVGRRSDAGGNRQDGRDTQARPGGDLGRQGVDASEQGAGGTEGRQGVTQTPRNSSINDVLYSITVNHNSPHLIKKADGTFVDPETGERLGFDHRFMSTGEGVQAHGWGSYFSVEDLRHYADDLSNPNTPPMRAAMRQQGRKWLEENPTFEAWKESKEFKDYYYNHEDSAFKYIEELKTRGPEWQADIEDIEKRIEERRRQREDEDYLRKQYGIEREAALTQSSRHHYDVEIPDDNGTNYFEENEPMKPEQIAMLQAQSDKEGAKAEVGGFLFYANPAKNPYADKYTFRKFLTDITSDMGGGLTAQQASEFFNRAGFTGIHYHGSRDGEGYVIFDENDAQIVDHLRFSVTDSSVDGETERIDEAYLKAVESGDMETAQRMVDEAAEKAGYTANDEYKDSHRAPSASVDRKDFTNLEALREVVENDSADSNLFAVAQGVSTQPDDYFSRNGARWYGYDDEEGMESYWNLRGAMDEINRQMEEYGEVREMPTVKVYRAVPKEIKGGQFESGGQWVTPSRLYAKDHGQHRFGYGKYRIVEQEVRADELWWDGNDINEWGFDDDTRNAYQNTKNNRKLLDAVTYDDEGNVIPLSQRFNKRNADIRFSTSNEADVTNTEAKDIAYNAVRQALANAGIEVEVATEEEVERLKAEMKTLQDSKGVVRGWVGNDGKIHLTKDGLNAETPIHEYTHLWAEALQMTNPDLWEQIKGLLKGTPEWQRITSMKEYSNLKDDDRIAGEVLAHISGKKNAERMEAEAKRMIDEAPTLEEAAKAANLLGRMRDALKKFWTWVGKTLLGKKGNINIDQVSNMVLADLTNGVDPFHPRGGKRTNRTKRTDASVDLSVDTPESQRMAVRDEFDELSGAHPTERAKTIRQKYEQLLTDQVNKFRPLKQLEEILAEKKGRKLRDSESFYSRATMTAARTLPQMEAEREIYLLPLEQAVNEVFSVLDPDGKRAGRRTKQEEGGRENETMKQLRQRMADYLIAKHGLERNDWFYQQALAKDPNAQEEDKSGLRGLAESLGKNPDNYKAVAEQVVKDFEAEVGQQGIDNLWKELNGFTNRLLEMSYNDGFTGKDHYEELKGRWKHYVPLRGFAEGTSDDMYYYTTQGGDSAVTMKKAKGRTSKPDDPLTHLVRMQEKAVTAGNDNWAKTALYNAAINLPSDLLRVKQVWYTEDPNTGEIIEHYADLTGLTSPDDIDAAIKQFNADMKAAGAKRRLNKADVGKRIRPQNLGEHEIEVWVNGKKVIIEVNGNPSLVRAYSESQDELKGFIKGVQKANRLEARLFTTWNPEFAVKNMMRDTNFALFSAFVIGGTKQWNETRKNIHTARLVLPKLMKDGTVSQTLVRDAADRQKLEQWYKEFIENGGETGFTRTMNAEQVSKDINDTLRAMAKGNEDGVTKMEKLAGAIEDLNRWAENSTRFAAYITARERGETVTKAMDAAKNSTLNFNIKGYEGKRLRAWFCFFNARLQGVAQLARLAKENPKRFAIGLGAAVLTGAMLPFLNTLLLGLGGDDDDWKTYEYMSEYTGNNNFVLFIPGIHKFVAIPYSQELAPFSAIGNIWFREAMGWNRNKSAWQQELEMGLAYLPMEVNLSDKEGTWPMLGSTVARSVAPTIMQPIVEYAVNENFMNVPLRKDSKYKSELAAWTQAYENRTSGALIKASKWLNGGGSENRWGKAEVLIDPSFIQHVVEGTAGGVGSFIGNTRDLFTEPDWFNHLPFVRKFMFDGDPKKWQGGLDRAYSAYAYDFIDERDRRIDAIRYDNQSTLDFARQIWAEHNSTDKAIYDLAKDYRDNLGKYKQKVNGHWVNMSSFGENPYRYKDNGRDLLPIIGIKGMRQYYNDLRANDAEQELIDEWRGRISEYEMQMIEEIEAVYYRENIQGKKPISEGLRKMVDNARGTMEDEAEN